MLNYALSALFVAVITLGVYANAWSKESALLGHRHRSVRRADRLGNRKEEITMIKRLFKWFRLHRERSERRGWKIRDYRNTALVVKLACTGSLTTIRRGASIIPMDIRRPA